MTVKRTRRLAMCALIPYCVILITFVVFKAIPTIHLGHRIFRFAGTHTGPANLVPFKTIIPLLSGRGNHLIAMVNLFGNIIPFMPLGFLVPFVFWPFSWVKALLLGVAVGLSFEVMELLFRVGIFDVDDVAMNAFGVMLGYGTFVIFKFSGKLVQSSS